MFDPAIVEVWGQPAGVALKEGNTYRFSATDRAFQALDGTRHATLGHVRLAAACLHRATPDHAWLAAASLSQAGASSFCAC